GRGVLLAPPRATGFWARDLRPWNHAELCQRVDSGPPPRRLRRCGGSGVEATEVAELAARGARWPGAVAGVRCSLPRVRWHGRGATLSRTLIWRSTPCLMSASHTA